MLGVVISLGVTLLSLSRLNQAEQFRRRAAEDSVTLRNAGYPRPSQYTATATEFGLYMDCYVVCAGMLGFVVIIVDGVI